VKSRRLQFAYTDVGHLAAVQQTFDDGRVSGNGCCFARRGGLIEVVTAAAAAALGTSDVTVIRSGEAFLSVFQNLDTGRRERIYRHANLVGDSGRQAAVSGGRKQWRSKARSRSPGSRNGDGGQRCRRRGQTDGDQSSERSGPHEIINDRQQREENAENTDGNFHDGEFRLGTRFTLFRHCFHVFPTNSKQYTWKI